MVLTTTLQNHSIHLKLLRVWNHYYVAQRLTQEGPANEEITIGPLTIKKESHQVTTTDGTEIQLTVLEFGILYLLASIQTAYLVQMEIFETVWQQESIVSTKTVMVHVSHLRDKIAEATGGEKVIETVWGVGYKIEDK